MPSPARPAPTHSPHLQADRATGALPQLLRPDAQKWRVLLADDNAINLEVGVALLQELGLAVQTAINGRDALDKLQAGACDLVLMDVQMPQMDGLAATRALRALPALQQLPVIAMTANASVQSHDDCLAAGMNDFVTKPIDIRHLAVVLQRWLPAVPA